MPRLRSLKNGSLVAPQRGKAPPCPKGYVRDAVDSFLFHPTKGYGDKLASIIDRLSRHTIKPCAGCQNRKTYLNNMTPDDSITIYQHLYDEGTYGQAEHDSCPGVRFLPRYINWLLEPIIDLGCGTGDTVFAMREEGFPSEGIDQVTSGEGMHIGDITKKQNLYKYLTSICIDVFEHLYDDQVVAVLKNMQQTTRQVISIHTSIIDGGEKLGIPLHVNVKDIEDWTAQIDHYLHIEKVITISANRYVLLCERKVQ